MPCFLFGKCNNLVSEVCLKKVSTRTTTQRTFFLKPTEFSFFFYCPCNSSHFLSSFSINYPFLSILTFLYYPNFRLSLFLTSLFSLSFPDTSLYPFPNVPFELRKSFVKWMLSWSSQAAVGLPPLLIHTTFTEGRKCCNFFYLKCW